jgi:hypothetical protein
MEEMINGATKYVGGRCVLESAIAATVAFSFRQDIVDLCFIRVDEPIVGNSDENVTQFREVE